MHKRISIKKVEALIAVEEAERAKCPEGTIDFHYFDSRVKLLESVIDLCEDEAKSEDAAPKAHKSKKAEKVVEPVAPVAPVEPTSEPVNEDTQAGEVTPQ